MYTLCFGVFVYAESKYTNIGSLNIKQDLNRVHVSLHPSQGKYP